MGNNNAFHNLGSSTARYGCCDASTYMVSPESNPFVKADHCEICPTGTNTNTDNDDTFCCAILTDGICTACDSSDPNSCTAVTCSPGFHKCTTNTASGGIECKAKSLHNLVGGECTNRIQAPKTAVQSGKVVVVSQTLTFTGTDVSLCTGDSLKKSIASTLSVSEKQVNVTKCGSGSGGRRLTGGVVVDYDVTLPAAPGSYQTQVMTAMNSMGPALQTALATYDINVDVTVSAVSIDTVQIQGNPCDVDKRTVTELINNQCCCT